MSPEQWQKIHELFEAALERSVEDRAAFLSRACAGDEETQRRVEAMLAADAQNDLLVDRPWRQAVNIFAPSNSGPDDSQSYSGEMIGFYRLIKELWGGGWRSNSCLRASSTIRSGCAGSNAKPAW